jgi:hypothetical protein
MLLFAFIRSSHPYDDKEDETIILTDGIVGFKDEWWIENIHMHN